MPLPGAVPGEPLPSVHSEAYVKYTFSSARHSPELTTGKRTRLPQPLKCSHCLPPLSSVGSVPKCVPGPIGTNKSAQTYPSGLLAGELGFTGLVGDGRPCFSMVSLTSSCEGEGRGDDTTVLLARGRASKSHIVSPHCPHRVVCTVPTMPLAI